MTIPEKIEERLREGLGAEEIRIEDLSEKHRDHPGASGGGGHYRVHVRAAAFRDLPLLDRHRMVYEALGDMMRREIHALALETRAPGEEGP